MEEYLARVLRDAQDRLARRILAAGLYLQGEAKRDYSRSNPAPHKNPAPKGEFPRGRTWNLRDSIAVQPETIRGIIAADQTVRVGYLPAAFYGAALANRGWKGILDTYTRCRGVVAAIIKGS